MAYNSTDTLGNFFKIRTASLTAANSDYTPILNEAGLSGSPSLASGSSEFSAILNFVHYSLGEPVVLVEITPEQCTAAFESAQLEFSSIVNLYFISSWMASLLGVSQNYSSVDFQSALPYSNNTFIQAFANSQIGTQGIYSGQHTKRKGYLDINTTQQMYDMYSSGIDMESGLPVEQYVASVTGYGVNWLSFYYNSGTTMNKVYDPYSPASWTNQELGSSFQADSPLYITPVWQDIQRGQVLNDMNYVRKSSYRHSIFGRKIEIIPKPMVDIRVYFDFYVDKQPGQSTDPLLQSSFSGLLYLSTSANPVATNFGNIPISDLTYATMNSVGRNWVRQMTLANCMQILALARGKIGTIPIPGSGESVTLNSADLLNISATIRNDLLTWLRTELDKMNLYTILEKETLKAQQLLIIKQLNNPGGVYVDSRLN